MGTDIPVKYHAFISYSHRQDGTFGKSLHRALEGFANPLFRTRAMRVFLDDASLPMTNDLWGEIEEAIKSSAFLLLLASPAAADSPWVLKELETFIRYRGLERVGIALTAGRTPWTDGNFQEESGAQALCPAAIDLLRSGTSEPLVIDLRHYRSAKGTFIRSRDSTGSIASIVSAIAGRDKDEIYGLHLTRLRHRIVAAVGLAGASVIAAGFAVYFAVEANVRANVADSRRLATQALNVLEASVADAARLSSAAFAISDTIESRQAMLATLQHSSRIQLVARHEISDATSWAVHRDGDVVAYGTGAGAIHTWSYASQRAVASLDAAHGTRVTAIALSPRTQSIASADAEGVVVVRNLANLTERLRFKAKGAVSALRFSLDGKTLAVAADDELKLHSLSDVNQPRTTEMQDAIRSVAFSPDGRFVAIGDENEWHGDRDFGAVSHVHLMDLRAGTIKKLTVQLRDKPVTSLGFDATSRFIASGWEDGRVVVWDLSKEDPGMQGFLSDKRYISRHNRKSIASVAFSPNSKILASVDEEGGVVLWSLSHEFGSHVSPRFMQHGTALKDVVFSRDGSHLVGVGTCICIWKVENIGRHDVGPARTSSLGTIGAALSANGEYFQSNTEIEYVRWRSSTGDQIERLPIGRKDGNLLALGPNAEYRLVKNAEGVWLQADRSQTDPLQLLPGNWSAFAETARFDRLGRYLAFRATRGDDSRASIFVWDIEARKLVTELPAPGNFRVMAFSSDGGMLALGGYGKAWIIELPSSKLLEVKWSSADDGPEEETVSLAFHPERRMLAIGGNRGSLVLWDIDRRETASSISKSEGRDIGSAIYGIAFSPDGSVLAATNGKPSNVINLWDLRSGSLIGQLLASPTAQVSVGLYFAEAGRRLISVGTRSSEDSERARRGEWRYEVIFWDIDPRSWARSIKHIIGPARAMPVAPPGTPAAPSATIMP